MKFIIPSIYFAILTVSSEGRQEVTAPARLGADRSSSFSAGALSSVMKHPSSTSVMNSAGSHSSQASMEASSLSSQKDASALSSKKRSGVTSTRPSVSQLGAASSTASVVAGQSAQVSGRGRSSRSQSASASTASTVKAAASRESGQSAATSRKVSSRKSSDSKSAKPDNSRKSSMSSQVGSSIAANGFPNVVADKSQGASVGTAQALQWSVSASLAASPSTAHALGPWKGAAEFLLAKLPQTDIAGKYRSQLGLQIEVSEFALSPFRLDGLVATDAGEAVREAVFEVVRSSREFVQEMTVPGVGNTDKVFTMALVRDKVHTALHAQIGDDGVLASVRVVDFAHQLEGPKAKALSDEVERVYKQKVSDIYFKRYGAEWAKSAVVPTSVGAMIAALPDNVQIYASLSNAVATALSQQADVTASCALPTAAGQSHIDTRDIAVEASTEPREAQNIHLMSLMSSTSDKFSKSAGFACEVIGESLKCYQSDTAVSVTGRVTQGAVRLVVRPTFNEKQQITNVRIVDTRGTEATQVDSAAEELAVKYTSAFHSVYTAAQLPVLV